jgi:hypothetical protein
MSTMVDSSKLPINPTSMGQTIYLCVMMSLLALNHLLDDHPRHVQYKKGQQCVTASMKEPTPQSTNVSTPSRSARVRTRVRHPHPYPADPRTKSLDSHGKTEQEIWPGDAVRRACSIPLTTPIPPSKLQMSVAWSRMRAASRLPSEPAKRARRRKKVSWGDVEVFEYNEQDKPDNTGTVAGGEKE